MSLSRDIPVVGVLTVSDRASAGEYEDLSGPAVAAYLSGAIDDVLTLILRVVPDRRGRIEEDLRELCDVEGCCLVVTTGGTGPAPRDVTPEATRAVCDRELAGFGERMRAVSLESVPTAILSRQTAGVRGRTLVINLPGAPRAIAECLDAVIDALPYCIDLIGGPRISLDPRRGPTFRPEQTPTPARSTTR
jgi:molybdopterin adenylyltransferase